jgi:hypothetical protein
MHKKCEARKKRVGDVGFGFWLFGKGEPENLGLGVFCVEIGGSRRSGRSVGRWKSVAHSPGHSLTALTDWAAGFGTGSGWLGVVQGRRPS